MRVLSVFALDFSKLIFLVHRRVRVCRSGSDTLVVWLFNSLYVPCLSSHYSLCFLFVLISMESNFISLELINLMIYGMCIHIYAVKLDKPMDRSIGPARNFVSTPKLVACINGAATKIRILNKILRTPHNCSIYIVFCCQCKQANISQIESVWNFNCTRRTFWSYMPSIIIIWQCVARVCTAAFDSHEKRTCRQTWQQRTLLPWRDSNFD